MYGLDIETDTTMGGLDPAKAPIVAIAIAGESRSWVFTGSEADILRRTDLHIRSLAAGVLVTWNGARFDLPFIADRANTLGVELGLTLVADKRARSRRDPLPGHQGGYLANWHAHTHLDAYRVYRADVGASLGIPCGLKTLARFAGLEPVEVDRTMIHELTDDELHAYVASDAELARELALRRWPTAVQAIDNL